MSKNQNKITDALIQRGFTGVFELFYWANDGWYAHCDQMAHDYIGQNTPHVLRCINEGQYDHMLKNGT